MRWLTPQQVCLLFQSLLFCYYSLVLFLPLPLHRGNLNTCCNNVMLNVAMIQEQQGHPPFLQLDGSSCGFGKRHHKSAQLKVKISRISTTYLFVWEQTRELFCTSEVLCYFVGQLGVPQRVRLCSHPVRSLLKCLKTRSSSPYILCIWAPVE